MMLSDSSGKLKRDTGQDMRNRGTTVQTNISNNEETTAVSSNCAERELRSENIVGNGKNIYVPEMALNCSESEDECWEVPNQGTVHSRESSEPGKEAEPGGEVDIDLQQRQTKFKICFNCGEEGHMAVECGVTLQNDKEVDTNFKGIDEEIRPNSNRIDTKVQCQVICKYCKLCNHEYYDCHKLEKRLGISRTTQIEVKFNKKEARNVSSVKNQHSYKSSKKFQQLKPRQVMTYEVIRGSTEILKCLEQSQSRRVIRAAKGVEIKNHIVLEANLLRKRTAFLMDTGLSISLIKIGKLRNGLPLLEDTAILQGIADEGISTLGKIVVYFKFGQEELGHIFHVVSNDFPCSGGILGEDFLESGDLDVRIISGRALSVNGSMKRFQKIKPISRTKCVIKSIDNAKMQATQPAVTHKQLKEWSERTSVSGTKNFKFDIRSGVTELKMEQRSSTVDSDAQRRNYFQSGQGESILRVQLDKDNSMEKQIFLPWRGGKMLEKKGKLAESGKARIPNGFHTSMEQLRQDSPEHESHLDSSNSHYSDGKNEKVSKQKEQMNLPLSEKLQRLTKRSGTFLLITVAKGNRRKCEKSEFILEFQRQKSNEKIIGDSYSLTNLSGKVNEFDKIKKFLILRLDP